MARPPKLTPHQTKEAFRRRDAGEPMRDIARTYNVSHNTKSARSRQAKPRPNQLWLDWRFRVPVVRVGGPFQCITGLGVKS
jgi:hypothetical protein